MNTNTKCPEGMHQVMICLTPEEHQQLHGIQVARNHKVGPGRLQSQWTVGRDLFNFGLHHVNRQTGELPASIDRNPTSTFPSTVFATDEDLRRVMDAYPYPCWAALPNNACIHVNPLLIKFTGHPVEEFLRDDGTGWIDMLHPEGRTEACRIFRDGFQTLGSFQNFYRLRRADGLYGWIEDWAYPFYRPSGHHAGYVGLMCIRGLDRTTTALRQSVISL